MKILSYGAGVQSTALVLMSCENARAAGDPPYPLVPIYDAVIMKRIRQLADFPEIGAPLSSIISLEVPYRFLVCGNYTAFYKVEGDEVHIIRVLLSRRNFMQILFGKSYHE